MFAILTPSQNLINDAGMSIGSPFEDMELESMLKIIDLNCKGATAITKVCLPYIIDGGTILEVSSTSAFVPNTNLIVYCASKSYISALSLGLREELKDRHKDCCFEILKSSKERQSRLHYRSIL